MTPQPIPDYPPLRDWSDYPHCKMADFLRQHTGKQELHKQLHNEDEDDESEDEDAGADNDRTVILIEGDIRVTEEQLKTLGYSQHVVVHGNLHVQGSPSQVLYVSGDLYCNTINLSELMMRCPVGGTVYARDCAWLWAEDHEVLRKSATVRLHTRFLFSWVYSIDNLALPADTVVFIVAGADYCSSLDLPNPVFTWHEAVYVLKAQFVRGMEADDDDGPPWRRDTIEPALEKGEDIFLDGFDVACMPLLHAASEAFAARDYRNAYLSSKQAATVAPAYYRAWLRMGNALRMAGAYEQALLPYQEAVGRFPVQQTGLTLEAATDGAECALRCRKLALAIQLATACINPTRIKYNGDAIARVCRIRAEAHLLSGNTQLAQADLQQALACNARNQPANWLMGLVHYRNGDVKQAKKFHKFANYKGTEFALYYDAADNTDFMSAPALRVDWDTQDAASATLPVKDQAFWHAFMRDSDPMQLKRVPEEFRSTALCMQVLAQSDPGETADFAQYFPAPSFSRELAEELVRRSPANLQYIPSALVDKALCMLAKPGEWGFNIKYVPQGQCDYDVCLRAAECGEDLSELPPEYIDKALCMAAIQRSPYAIEQVPVELIDDDLYMAVIAYGDPYRFNNLVPGRYKTSAMLKQVVSRYKRRIRHHRREVV